MLIGVVVIPKSCSVIQCFYFIFVSLSSLGRGGKAVRFQGGESRYVLEKTEREWNLHPFNPYHSNGNDVYV